MPRHVLTLVIVLFTFLSLALSSTSKTFSPVLRDHQGHWAEFNLLMVHEPIRADLARLEKAIKPEFFDGKDEWKVEALFEWFKQFSHGIHVHHQSEDEFLFPALEQRHPLSSTLKADHRELVLLLKEIEALEVPMKEGSGNGKFEDGLKTIDYLRTKVHELQEHLNKHLNDEEKEVLGYLKSSWTEKEWDEVIERLQSHSSIFDAAHLVGGFLSQMKVWGDEKDLNKFFSKLPSPFVVLVQFVWEPLYTRDYVGLIESIPANKPHRSLPSFFHVLGAVAISIVLLIRRRFGRLALAWAVFLGLYFTDNL